METNVTLPEHAACLDAGTSVRDILFDILLSERKPRRIILVDAADSPGRTPGEIFEIDPAAAQGARASDFSLHQFPTTSLLQELAQEGGTEVTVLCVQVGEIPDEVRPGLSHEVERALPEMGERIRRLIGSQTRPTENPGGEGQ
jgi:coenzyme F420 hydrogenase subunit delta